MRATKYVNGTEGRDFLLMYVIWDSLLALIDSTKEVPRWQGYLASALMQVCTVWDLRVRLLDPKEQTKAKKRLHSVDIVPKDYNFGNRRQINYTVPEEDLLKVVNLACEKYCYGCTKKKWRSCEWRQCFNHLGMFSLLDGTESGKDVCQFMVERFDEPAKEEVVNEQVQQQKDNS